LFTFSDELACLSTILLLAFGRQNIAPFRELTPLRLGALGPMMAGLFVGNPVDGGRDIQAFHPEG
jgi:hypothetical protein